MNRWQLKLAMTVGVLAVAVETYRGVVRLRGFVDTANERDAAETSTQRRGREIRS